MLSVLKKLIAADWQTKLFLLMLIIYSIALIWTTLQSYARLEYSRSDQSKQIIIEPPKDTTK